jgi:hypothetical protein
MFYNLNSGYKIVPPGRKLGGKRRIVHIQKEMGEIYLPQFVCSVYPQNLPPSFF